MRALDGAQFSSHFKLDGTEFHAVVHPQNYDDVIAYACCSPKQNRRHWYVVISRFAMKEEYRRCGHGKRLLDLVKQHYGKPDLNYYFVSVRCRSEVLAFYRKPDFAEKLRTPNYYKTGDTGFLLERQ